MRRLLASCLLVLALAACDPGSQALFLTANIASYVQTDKTLVDHGVSYAKDEDCSTLTWAEGEGYCQAEEEASEDIAMETAAAEAEPGTGKSSWKFWEWGKPAASTTAAVVTGAGEAVPAATTGAVEVAAGTTGAAMAVAEATVPEEATTGTEEVAVIETPEPEMAVAETVAMETTTAEPASEEVAMVDMDTAEAQPETARSGT